MTTTILHGDCRQVLPTLATASVHCVVTSPPYYRLRSYLPADHPLKTKEMGSEQRLDCMGWATGARCGACFICALVDVFREMRRVLRPDGVCWINLGDSWATGTSAPRNATSTTGPNVPASWSTRNQSERCGTPAGLKTKDLLGAPWRLAMALQADGWWWRDTVVWHKPNPMPSSVDDRCTPAWEPMLMMTPSARYFFDWRAVATEAVGSSAHDLTGSGRRGVPGQSDQRGNRGYKMPDGWATHEGRHGSVHRDGREKGSTRYSFARESKNTAGEHGQKPQHRPDRAPVDHDQIARKRNVWSIPTSAFREAHYATFPPALVEPCILSSTSAHGCCPACGAPWMRHRIDTGERREVEKYTGQGLKDYAAAGVQDPSDTKRRVLESMSKVHREGWLPSCGCDGLGPLPVEPRPPAGDADDQALRAHKAAIEAYNTALWALIERARACKVVPAVVLDIFGGSGTTGLVADRLGRHAVLIELGEDNVAMSRRRITEDAPLLAQVT